MAFTKTYVAPKDEYRSYLKASYAQAISKSFLKLKLVPFLTATQLYQVQKLSCSGASAP
ncbi:hypothetical protein [Nostoc flagelliforme]|uniref:hypothetical protein n=1 Tax=Nostoc flagelliforme TaxID=1306274 RepID=UPI00142DC359|nr:hypothetical protein [Nostoc flagelliforme]